MHSGHVSLAATASKVDVVLTGEECMSGSSDRRRTTESSQRWRVMALCIVSGFPSVDAMTGRSCWNVKAASEWAHAGVAVTIVDGSPTDDVLLKETCAEPHSTDNVLHGVRGVIRENLERYTRSPGDGSVSGDVVSCVAGDTRGRLAALLHVDRSFIRFCGCGR